MSSSVFVDTTSTLAMWSPSFTGAIPYCFSIAPIFFSFLSRIATEGWASPIFSAISCCEMSGFSVMCVIISRSF